MEGNRIEQYPRTGDILMQDATLASAGHLQNPGTVHLPAQSISYAGIPAKQHHNRVLPAWRNRVASYIFLKEEFVR
jgi:hypothetical protein